MPIFLKAPEYQPGGPDGQGWNRLSLNAHMGRPRDRCALRPRSYATLRESQDTRRAQWAGDYGLCVGEGNCDSCEIYLDEPAARIPWDGDGAGRVLVRIRERTQGGALYAMQDADLGWDSRAVRLTWEEAASIPGWDIGRAHQDQHGPGFWISRATASTP